MQQSQQGCASWRAQDGRITHAGGRLAIATVLSQCPPPVRVHPLHIALHAARVCTGAFTSVLGFYGLELSFCLVPHERLGGQQTHEALRHLAPAPKRKPRSKCTHGAKGQKKTLAARNKYLDRPHACAVVCRVRGAEGTCEGQRHAVPPLEVRCALLRQQRELGALNHTSHCGCVRSIRIHHLVLCT